MDPLIQAIVQQYFAQDEIQIIQGPNLSTQIKDTASDVLLVHLTEESLGRERVGFVMFDRDSQSVVREIFQNEKIQSVMLINAHLINAHLISNRSLWDLFEFTAFDRLCLDLRSMDWQTWSYLDDLWEKIKFKVNHLILMMPTYVRSFNPNLLDNIFRYVEVGRLTLLLDSWYSTIGLLDVTTDQKLRQVEQVEAYSLMKKLVDNFTLKYVSIYAYAEQNKTLSSLFFKWTAAVTQRNNNIWSPLSHWVHSIDRKEPIEMSMLIRSHSYLILLPNEIMFLIFQCL